MSVIFGETNCGKSFLALDLSLHVAMGKRWHGREVEQGAVIYLALEGSYGIQNRMAAFKKVNSLEGADLAFAIVPVGINLLDAAVVVSRMIDAVKAEAERMGVPVKLIVVDTLSRALAGGDENSSQDMGALVANANRIRQAVGAHVLLIHHSGKDATRGARSWQIECSRRRTASRPTCGRLAGWPT